MNTTQEQTRRIADLHVLCGQNEVVEELIRAGKIDEEYVYPFVDTDDEIFEWWLVTPWLAERLKEQGEVVIDALDCHGGVQTVKRTGCLHGCRNTGDCRSVKHGLHIDMAKLQITEIRGFAISERFYYP